MPLVTLVLVALNVLAFRLELASGGEAFCYAHGLIPAQFARSGDFGPLMTSLFLHDPSGLAHIGANMTFLLVFGALVEGALGSLPFLALYGLAGAAGGLLHVLVAPTATIPLVGASGAVFGVLAVAAVLRPRLLGFAVAVAGVEVWHALAGGNGNVSFGCHLGGFAAGAFAALVLRAAGSEAMETA
jgi:membrane associated rhomboid family serine protease